MARSSVPATGSAWRPISLTATLDFRNGRRASTGSWTTSSPSRVRSLKTCPTPCQPRCRATLRLSAERGTRRPMRPIFEANRSTTSPRTRRPTAKRARTMKSRSPPIRISPWRTQLCRACSPPWHRAMPRQTISRLSILRPSPRRAGRPSWPRHWRKRTWLSVTPCFPAGSTCAALARHMTRRPGMAEAMPTSCCSAPSTRFECEGSTMPGMQSNERWSSIP